MDNKKIEKEIISRNQIKFAVNFIKNEISEGKKKKLLDVGSADNVLKKFLPENIEYYSLDLPSEEHFPEPMRDDYSFIMDLDKEKIPVKNNFFDIIICLDVLEHTMYPQKVIDELKRVSKPDATFVFSLPNEYNFLHRIYYLLAIKTDTEMPWKVVEKHMHIQKPRVKDIINLMSENFKIEGIKFHWESRKSEGNSLFRIVDKGLSLLAPISPNLFSRDVVVLAKKKKS